MSKNKKKGVMVVQSNDLIEAYYASDLKATEHKIIRYAASKIKDNPNNFPRVTFTVQEFLDATGIKGNGYHQKIDQISKELSSKTIDITTKDNKSGKYFPWFSEVSYDDGFVVIEFNYKIKPLLLELEGQFTKYNYMYIGDMKSGYSIRLFELMKQYAKIGKRRIRVDTLKKMLGIEDKYEKYSQFKLRVLNQAKKELDQKEDLTFRFEEIKEGRKVVELIFHINAKEKQLDFDDIIDDQQKDIKIFIKEARMLLDNYPHFSSKITDNMLQNWSKYGINLLSSVLNEAKNRSVDYPGAYLDTILESKYGKQQSMKNKLKIKSDSAFEKVSSFIEENTSNEIIPDWFLKPKFDSYMKDSFEEDEIDKIWEENKKFILEKTYKPKS